MSAYTMSAYTMSPTVDVLSVAQVNYFHPTKGNLSKALLVSIHMTEISSCNVLLDSISMAVKHWLCPLFITKTKAAGMSQARS